MGGKQAGTTSQNECNSGGILRQVSSSIFILTRESGQNLVEFAIVLPLLLLFIFGAVDLGRLFHAHIAITNAAREGSRFGGLNRDRVLDFDTNVCNEPLENMLYQVGGVDFNEIIFVSCAEGRTSGIDIARMTITPSCPLGCNAHKPVLITVKYDFDFLLGNFIPGIGTVPGPNLTLQRTSEMMLQ